MPTGILYIVATPIGHLADITLRAIDTLKSVDLILTEDTRHAKKLLNHYLISTRVKSFHEHNEKSLTPTVLAMLDKGQNLALISDAGTPLMSDPGFFLVQEAKKIGITVTPIPGACALISALSASGLATDKFYFAGFIPAKPSQRQHFFQRFTTCEETLIFYESTHRILKSLADAAACFGAKRQACLAKELTKLHETLITDHLINIIAWLKDDAKRVKGEFVLLIAGQKNDKAADAPLTIELDHLLRSLSEVMSIKDAALLAAKMTDRKKNTLYNRLLKLQSAAD